MHIPAHFAETRTDVLHDEDYIRGAVPRLTQIRESSEANPWKLTDSPESFINGLLKAIVGIEIEMTRLIGKTKLSQNKSERDIRSAAEMLQSRGQQIAGESMLAEMSAKSERTL